MTPAPIHTDPRVSRLLGDGPAPDGWHQRSLYVGDEAGAAWLATADGLGARADRQRDRLRSMAVATEAATFVSFGPGDGRLDGHVTAALGTRLGPPTYIPVDLNRQFLRKAMAAVAESAVVPFGVVADFESDLTFLGDRIADLPRPVLFGLFGGTLGNLDRLETNFVDLVAGVARPGDFLAVDAVLSGPSAGLNSVDDLAGRRFLALGAARQTGEPVAAVLARYDRVRVRPGRSRVANAAAVDVVYDPPSGSPVRVLRCCAYPPDALRAWAEQLDGFELREDGSSLVVDPDGALGVLLLRRR